MSNILTIPRDFVEKTPEGALLLEKNDEWVVRRARVVTLESIGAIVEFTICLPTVAT